MRIRLLFVIVGVLTTTASADADWSTCASNLTKLHRASRDAAAYADGLDNKKRAAENERKKYDDCRRYPEVYDLLRDGCESIRFRAENASNSYKSDIRQFEVQMDEVRRYSKKVESSCGDEDATPRLDPRTLCTMLKQMRKEYSDAEILEACKTQATEAFCTACLGIP